MKTISDALTEMTAHLEAAELSHTQGFPSAFDEASALVLYVMKLPQDSDDSVLTQPVNDIAWAKMCALVEQRIVEKMPMAYLIHEAWFMGLPFIVDERVLIPRSPFAEWLSRRFSPFVAPENVLRILEIGTGSGCIAIAAASVFPNASVDAVDVCPDALEVAALNVQKYQLESRVTLYEGDCYAPLPDACQYDLILSNPPYVSEMERGSLPDEFNYEPVNQALFADDDGMAIVDKILKGAAARMTEAAILSVEVGFSEPFFIQHYPDLPATWLDCEFGGQGLLLLTKAQLEASNVGK